MRSPALSPSAGSPGPSPSGEEQKCVEKTAKMFEEPGKTKKKHKLGINPYKTWGE